jgi:hypothetical protein
MEQDIVVPPAPTISKRGGRRPGAGRGRGGHHAAVIAERDSKTGSPKDIPGSGGETSNSGPSHNHPNGNSGPGKRGRNRKESHVSNESDKDKSDGNRDVTSDPSRRGGESNGNGTHHNSKGDGTTAKPGKDPSMLELKKRAAMMLEFLSSAQADMPKAPDAIGIEDTSAVLLTGRGNEVSGSPLIVEAERLKGRLEKWQLDFA